MSGGVPPLHDSIELLPCCIEVHPQMQRNFGQAGVPGCNHGHRVICLLSTYSKLGVRLENLNSLKSWQSGLAIKYCILPNA